MTSETRRPTWRRPHWIVIAVATCGLAFVFVKSALEVDFSSAPAPAPHRREVATDRTTAPAVQRADRTLHRSAVVTESTGPEPSVRTPQRLYWRVTTADGRPVERFLFEVQSIENRNEALWTASVHDSRGQIAIDRSRAPAGEGVAIHPFSIREAASTFYAPGKWPSGGPESAPTIVRVDLLEGRSVSVVSGFVENSAGQPIEGARVDLSILQNGHPGWLSYSRTDDTGHFRLPLRTDFPSAVRLLARASHRSHGISEPRMKDRLPGADADFGAALVLRHHELNLSVRTTTGEPVEGVTLEGAHTALWKTTVVTDALGRCRTHAPRATTWHLTGAARQRWSLPTKLVAHDSKRDGSELRLVLLESASLSGLVLGPDGFPAKRAVVEVFDTRRGTRSTVGCEPRTGRFTLSGLARGSELEVIARGAFESRVSRVHHVTLSEPHASIEARLNGQQAWADARVTATTADVRGPVTIIGTSRGVVVLRMPAALGARNRLWPLPAGEYDLHAEAAGFVSPPLRWSVPENPAAETLDLELRPALQVRCSVDRESVHDSLLVGAFLAAVQPARQLVVPMSGRRQVNIGPLAPGDTQFELRDAAGRSLLSRRLTLQPDHAAPVVLPMRGNRKRE